MNFGKLCKAAPLAIVLAAGAFAETAQAEQYYSDNDVTIYSPYIVKKERGVRPLSNRGDVTVTRKISLLDYDLRRNDDIYRLNREVEFTARDVCEKANLIEPASYAPSETRECYQDALRDAQRQVRRAVNRASYYRY
jgi:UrcA family protein